MKTYIYKRKRKHLKKKKRRKEGKDNQDSCQGQEPSSQKAAGFRNSQNPVVSKESAGEEIKTSSSENEAKPRGIQDLWIFNAHSEHKNSDLISAERS